MSDLGTNFDFTYDASGNVVGINGQPFQATTDTTATSAPSTDGATPTSPPPPPTPPPPPPVGNVDQYGNITTSGAGGTPATNNIVDTVSGQATGNTTLTPNTTVKPKDQVVDPNTELLKDLQKQVTELASKQKAPIDFKPQEAVTAGSNFSQQQAQATANAQYDPSLIGNDVPQAVAAHGAVTSDMTVAGQLSRLMDFGSDDMPFWAVGARRVAEDAMAARGLGASSIAGAAITQAIMEAGIPIATADAQTYTDIAKLNLTNDQQTALENVRARQTAMLSDQAAQNAARQFNATSRTQTAQFFSNLIAETDRFNVSQRNAMSQFNATQQVSIGLEGWKLDAAIDQFNAQQQNAMQQFYTQNQLAIDQSNAAWRRSVNTANTQNENEAQRINATNLLGITNTAMNNLWQMFRDQASWVQQASENEADRAANMAIAAFNRDVQLQLQRIDNKQQNKNTLYRTAGQFAINILSSMFD